MNQDVTALLGGSFDPVHLGHTDIAAQLLKRYGFKEILFVPAFQNPLKAHTRAKTEQRLKLLELALADTNEPRFKVCDWEIRRATPSFTVDTLEHLQKTYGKLALLIGNEVFAEFPHWRSPLKIFSLASIVCFSRTSVEKNPCPQVLKTLGAEATWTNNRAPLPDGNWIEWCPLTALPYSSTELRAQLGRGKTPAGLSPSPLRFIKDHALYTEE